MTEAPLRIAHVTPHPIGSGSGIDVFAGRVTGELAARGHRVLVVGASAEHDEVREARAALREARGRPDALFREGEARVLALGEVLPPLPAGRGASLPVDVGRAVEELHAVVPLDVCHVHEPFAPSLPSAALRHSRALNVGTFHLPTERVLSTQVARRVVELVFGRLDARTASFAATRELMRRFFPADYRVLRPGVEAPSPVARADSDGPVRLAFVEREERGALRTFLRGLRALDPALPWTATVLSPRGAAPASMVRAALRERVRFAAADELGEDELLAWGDVLVAASDGGAPAPGLVLRARAAGLAVLASRLAVYEEVVEDGEAGLLFEPRDAETLGAQLARLVRDAGLRERLTRQRPERSWGQVAGEVEELYGELVARRHDGRADPQVRRRVRERRLIDVDLHMHTDHSPDCATPVEVLLATARERGLGAIAVTDHNEVSGALAAAEQAERFGVKVVVGEEVKTASQGEVIGLFLRERIPRGLSLAETVAEIRRQGGLVYVPHPFDRLHAVPDYEHLLGVLEDVDALEVFNPRVAIGSFNEEAERFAAKYRIVAGAGSDSHVAQGLGSVGGRGGDF